MSTISGLTGTSNQYNTPNNDAFSELTSGEFLQIIFTELQNQDPFEPNDSQAMLEQLATIRSIESDTQMGTRLNELVRQNELAAASGLIGSLVSGITLDNRRVADLVVSVSQTSDGAVLNLFDGSRMFFSNVDEIVGPLETDNPDDDPDDDDPTDPTDPTDPPDPTDPTDPPPNGVQTGPNAKVDTDTITDTGTDTIDDPKQEILVSPLGR